MENFKNKTAVITGASSGMGFLSSECFAKQGANVVMLATNPEKLEAKVKELTDAGLSAIGVPTDVRDYEQVKAACKTAWDVFGSLDIVVNLAGGSELRIKGIDRSTPFHEVPIEVYDWGLDVNMKGQFYLSHAAMKYMAEQKSGVIINIGSVIGAEACRDDLA